MRRVIPLLLVVTASCEFMLHDYSVNEDKIGGVSALACRGRTTCALLGTGKVKCWGWNDYGQLGNGTTEGSPSPVDVIGLPSAVEDLVDGGAGGRHFCALLNAGSIKCWGDNGNGQLGDNTREARSTAVYVTGILSGARAVTAGSWHSCALLGGGGVRCWGLNDAGQLGDGTTEERIAPSYVSGLGEGVRAIAAGGFHTCALLETGGLTCWGNNVLGQLGGGTVSVFSTTPAALPSLTAGVGSVSAGGNHTCALLETGGLRCWGDNTSGQLGDGTTTGRMEPRDVPALTSGVMAVSAGCNHTCALLESRAVQCWGDNDFGQLGDGTTADRPEPAGVAGLDSGIFSVVAGCTHTCALRSNGKILCWGENVDGQLGTGTNVNQSLPVEVYFQ
jgi:alpha-tubulin suppressor-like RCC1 family protein